MKLKAKRVPTGKSNVVSFELPVDCLGEYAALLRKAAERGDWWMVDFEPWHPKRSTGAGSQSAHFNGHVQQIANATGNDFADVKLFCKRAAMRDGLPAKTRANGDIVYSLVDGEPVPISEADMTSQQCSWCIEAAHLIAAELGITLQEVEQ